MDKYYYYNLLDLDYNSYIDEDKLKKAYRQKARLYHPDITKEDTISDFNEIKTAYDFIMQDIKHKKRIYKFPTRGKNIEITKSLTIDDVCLNRDIIVSYNNKETCKLCSGEGCGSCDSKGLCDITSSFSLNLKNICYKRRYCFKMQGESGAYGGPSGDLLVSFNLLKHSLYKISSNCDYNLIMDYHVSIKKMIQGGIIEVPTPYNTIEKIFITRSMKSASKINVGTYGLFDVFGKKGNLYIRLLPYIPDTIDNNLKDFLNKESNLNSKEEEIKDNKMIFDKINEVRKNV